MKNWAKFVLEQGLALNQRASKTAVNSIDWFFNRDTLIKSGATWFELVYDTDLMSVRYYELPDEDEIELLDGSFKAIKRRQHAVPLVLVPPLGVATNAFDLMPQRSLVRYMVASGFKVYLVDWGKPTKEHGHLGLKDYSHDMFGAALEKIRLHSGSQDLSTLGWCMGGLLCLLYQGQTKDRHLRNIITVASPIDLESGSGVAAGLTGIAQALNGPAQLVSNYSDLRFDALNPAWFSLPPWLTTLVFKMTDPVGSVTTYWDLVTSLSDREFVESHSTKADQLNHMLMYPGGVLKDMAIKVVGDNQLAKGRVEVGDNIAELDTIQSNFLAFAGDTDGLVPPETAEKIVEIVASKDKEFRIAPGGHMGVIIGSKAQKAVWAESAAWLGERSGTVRRRVKVKKKSAVKARPKSKRKTTAVSRERPRRKK